MITKLTKENNNNSIINTIKKWKKQKQKQLGIITKEMFTQQINKQED